MSLLRDRIRAAIAATMAAHPDLTVTVKIGSVTGIGIRSAYQQGTALTDEGEAGVTTSTLRVDAGVFGKPERGQKITIGGQSGFVTGVATDALNACWMIDWQKET